ncbi:tripartite motif-containing protein 16-like [Centroberyx gerrardi]
MESVPEPKTREEFLKFSCHLTLDPNTVNEHLSLSEGNRKVTETEEALPYPDHPDRFTVYYQVLCGEALSGTHYWEVEWTGGCVNVAVSYRDIRRTGDGVKCWLGGSEHAWSLVCVPSSSSVFHDMWEELVADPSPRVGVYLDHSAGILSFYSICSLGKMTLIHRVQTTFTQPLHPGFLIGDGSGLSILTPLESNQADAD